MTTSRSRCGFICGVFTIALIALSPTAASAVTFSWTVSCPTDTVVGPITVLALIPPISGTVDVTQNVPVTVALLPQAILIRQDNNDRGLHGDARGTARVGARVPPSRRPKARLSSVPFRRRP